MREQRAHPSLLRGCASRCALAATLGASALGRSSVALAESPVEHAAPVVRPYGIAVEAEGGGSSDVAPAGAMFMYGVGITARAHLLELGVVYEQGGLQAFSGSTRGGSGLVGVGWDATPRVRLAAVGELGFHQYDHLGGTGILDGPAPVGASFWNAGARAGVTVATTDTPTRVNVGLWLFARDDLGREDVPTTCSTSFLAAPTACAVHVGQWHSGLLLRVGFETRAL